MMMGLCLVAVLAWTNTANAGDCKGCETIKAAGEGFCDHCGGGMIYGLKVKSKKLYDALAGDGAKLAKVKESKCAGCKSAAAEDGACAHCDVFVANGKVYKSKTAQILGRSKLVSSKMLERCGGCATAAKDNGSCTGCDAHFVGNHKYKSKSFQEAALTALKTVKAAIKDAAHCENCALARVADASCKGCDVTFKNGKPVS